MSSIRALTSSDPHRDARFTRRPTTLDSAFRSQDGELDRRAHALRSWIHLRLEQETNDAAGLGEVAPSASARRAAQEWVDDLASALASDEGISVDLHVGDAGGVVIAVDHDPGGRRIVLEFDSSGAMHRLKRVSTTGVTTHENPRACRDDHAGLTWLCAG